LRPAVAREPAPVVGHTVGVDALDDVAVLGRRLVAAVARHLVAGGGQQLTGRDTVACEVAVLQPRALFTFKRCCLWEPRVR
jgi:hypothetical protein